jgi:hypothetical protein
MLYLFKINDMRYSKDKASIELTESEREKLLLSENCERKKQQLISELKTGLGAQIKLNPGKVKIIKQTKSERFKNWLKNIFTKF